MTHFSRLSLLVVLLIALLTAASTDISYAQDPSPTPTLVPTDTATWTPTPIPTDTATWTPVPTATDAPTATLTETPTLADTPTETATLAEVTPEVTEEASATPTLSETPTETATPTQTPSYTPTTSVITTPDGFSESLQFGIEGLETGIFDIPAGDTTALLDAVSQINGECLSGKSYVINLSSGSLYYLMSPVNTYSGLVITCGLTINGNDATLQRNSAADFRIIEIVISQFAANRDVEMNNLTVENGSLTTSGVYGGGLYYNGGGHLTLSRVTFSQNFNHFRGGGAYLTAPLAHDAFLIEDSIFDRNSAYYDGGGLYVSQNAHGTIQFTNFTNNSVERWGGGLNHVNGTGGSLIIQNTLFESNQVTGGSNAFATGSALVDGPYTDTQYSCFNNNIANVIGSVENWDIDNRTTSPVGSRANNWWGVTGWSTNKNDTDKETVDAVPVNPLPQPPDCGPRAQTATPTPTFTPTLTATPTLTPTVTPSPTPTEIILPACTALESLYTSGFDPRQNNTDSRFETYLTDPSTSPDLRQSCWRLYEDIIFLAIFHELAEDEIISWNEFQQLDSITYSSFVSGFQRQIAADGSETEMFTTITWDPKWDHRYLFARTIINGMSDEYASSTFDPMRYFARNYSETVSNNWMGVTPFCGGANLLTSFESLPNSCLLRDWYSTSGVQLFRDTPVYEKYISIIRNAIEDEVTGIVDPTDGAFGARPANRRWGTVVQNLGLGPHSNANPPHQPFIFSAVVGQVVKLQWANVTYDGESEWYPNGIWASGSLVPISNLPGCVDSSETIPQAYMRHLRELFNQAAQNDLLGGNGRTFYGPNDARFGIPWDPSSTSALGIHAHVLWPNWNNDVVTALSWYTFRFTRPMRKSGEVVGTRPLFGNEYIIDSNGNVVISTPNGVLQPVACP